jgi:DNA invertase Pin-like site-specific DNA recombinase
MFIRAYLRASSAQQDASRARGDLERFAVERGLRIAAFYIENESGATLRRPELMRLLGDAQEGDVCLLEQIDRLSRLNAEDWETLKAQISARKLKIVALDLPTSWPMLSSADPDDITARMFAAINSMMLDLLAALARKDYDDRRRRQAQGIARAKAEGVYRGRQENVARNKAIMDLLGSGLSWNAVVAATGCSRSTLSKLSKRQRASVAVEPVG